MWQGSPHEERGLACTNCHTVMKAVSARFQLKTAFQPDTCFQCHKDLRAKMFMSAHMPMGEGKIVCSDCHNPHGSFTEAMLRTDTINDTCYKCHAEKRGPFLFEHAPVRENCLNCHDPHGSVNEYLLKMPARGCASSVTPSATEWCKDPADSVSELDGPVLPELPHQYSWQQQSGRRGVPAVIRGCATSELRERADAPAGKWAA